MQEKSICLDKKMKLIIFFACISFSLFGSPTKEEWKNRLQYLDKHFENQNKENTNSLLELILILLDPNTSDEKAKECMEMYDANNKIY